MNHSPAPIGTLARICLPQGLGRDAQNQRAAEIVPILAEAQRQIGEDIAPWLLTAIPGEGRNPAQMLRAGEDERVMLLLVRAA